MHQFLPRLRTSAAKVGLNLVAALPVSRYDAQVAESYQARQLRPTARTVVAIANGGRDFWSAFLAHCARHPGWRERPDPLDDFTRQVVERGLLPVAAEYGVEAQPIYPFVGGGPTLNFMQLGICAGLAGPSLLGVVINPTFGPWIAFRAALLLDIELGEPGPAADFNPCPGCVARSCIPACPVGAITASAGWDIPRCLKHRVEIEHDCASRCHARTSCVLGPEHRYADDELAYHQERALRAMRPYYIRHMNR
jgi:epoxyqueuosine reductase